MQPAPTPADDEADLDKFVEDPLSDEVQQLWNTTAKKNTLIFEELFRTVPTDKVRNWGEYTVRSNGVRWE